MPSSSTSSDNLGAFSFSTEVLAYTVDYWGYHSMMSQDERQHGELSKILNRALLDRNNALDFWIYARRGIPLHPLEHICRWNLIEFLDPLLHAISEAGWSLDSICLAYELMIDIAGSNGHSKMLQILLPQHKSISSHLRKALEEAADGHHTKTASSLLAHSAIIGPEHLPALTKPTERGHLDTFEKVPKMYPDVNAKWDGAKMSSYVGNLSQRSILYTAVASGQEQIARMLLQNGATLAAFRWTPRTLTPLNDKFAMMELLRKNGGHIIGMLNIVLPGSIRKCGARCRLESGANVRVLPEEHPLWFFHTWRYDEDKVMLLLLYLVRISQGLADDFSLMGKTDSAIRAGLLQIIQEFGDGAALQ